MIKLQNITKQFRTKSGTVRAVDDINLHVKKGEIHGVIGYSGAGKSTLIRCVNLLEHPTSGSVKIDGVDLTTLSENELRKTRRKIGMIFQGFNLLKTATVYENVAIPLRLLGYSKKEVETRVEKYLAIVGLSDRQQSYPSQLSGGQKQRVAIARAVIHEPSLLLADEPTGNLDSKAVNDVMSLFESINKTLKTSILMVTHDAYVASFAQRVVFIKDGTLYNEVYRGKNKQQFYQEIMDTLAFLGGGQHEI